MKAVIISGIAGTAALLAIVGYFFVVPFVLYLMNLAELYSPSAKDLASALTPVAVNGGIALGSAAGGLVVAAGSIALLPWAGGLSALIAAGLASLSYGLDRKEACTRTESVPTE